MNEICGGCGGYIGNFQYVGSGAKICNCNKFSYSGCLHCYCKRIGPGSGGAIGPEKPHKVCCNCGNQQEIFNNGITTG